MDLICRTDAPSCLRVTRVDGGEFHCLSIRLLSHILSFSPSAVCWCGQPHLSSCYETPRMECFQRSLFGFGRWLRAFLLNRPFKTFALKMQPRVDRQWQPCCCAEGSEWLCGNAGWAPVTRSSFTDPSSFNDHATHH